MALGACGDRFSGGQKERLDGDTVQQNLVLAIAAVAADLPHRGDQASRSRVRHCVRGDNWSEGRLRYGWHGFLGTQYHVIFFVQYVGVR